MKTKHKIGLFQFGENFGGQYYLPYSIGLLQAYAQKKLVNVDDFEFLPPIYKRLPIDEIVMNLREAQAACFSIYIWNFRFSLEVARRLKAANSDCITILGGPQIPARPEALEKLLRDYTYIDIGCYGEGEIPFLRILENIPERSWTEVPSIGFIDSKNRFIVTPVADRITDLDEIPSPYLEGIFDSLMAANPEEKWSALWESNRGCPFNCCYCTWGATPKNKVYRYGMDRVIEELNWFSQKKIEFVFCCDANFGLFKDRDLRIAEKVAENKKKYGYPRAFSVQSTKNATKTIFRLNKILNDAGLQKGVNLALQSVNDKTLRSIKRNNISLRAFQDLQKMFTVAGIPTFSDMIIGLPEETYESFVNGAAAVVAGGQHNRIQFINLTLLENSELAETAYREKYGLILKECQQISHHTSLASDNTIMETECLVVGTNTMPVQDWIKTRVFCWMMSLLYFNKLFQIPFAIMNRACSLGYKEMVEIFLKENKRLRVISEIQTIFYDKAKAIQSGDCEYIPSPDWLNIWWPPDEYVFIKLCRQSILPQFYEEAAKVVNQYLKKSGRDISEPLLQEAINVNAQLIKKPFTAPTLQIFTSNNLLEIYKASLIGKKLPLQSGEHRYEIIRDQIWESWDEWCREGVWYGTKKGAYLYDFREI